MRKFLSCIDLRSLLFFAITIFGLKSVSGQVVSGYVLSSDNAKPINFALISDAERNVLGRTDSSGFYQVRLDSTIKVLTFSRFDYERQEIEIKQDTHICAILEIAPIEIPPFEVMAYVIPGQRYYEDQNDTLVLVTEEDSVKFVNKSWGDGHGEAQWVRHLIEQINYPDSMLKNFHEDKVVVRFTIDEEGSLSKLSLRRGPPMARQAVFAALNTMPKWPPRPDLSRNGEDFFPREFLMVVNFRIRSVKE